MRLAPSTLLAPHFTARELGADAADISAAAQANLYEVAAWLESARRLFGDRPIHVSSGYRSPSHNTDVGGSATSDHPNGLAADFSVSGVSLYHAYQLLGNRGGVPPFDQIIFYPIDGHIHVGLGARKRGEFRIALAEGGYPLLTSELVGKLRGSALPVLLILLAVVLVGRAVLQKGA